MIKWLKSILNTVSVDHFNGVTAELADQAHRAEQALRLARLEIEGLRSDKCSLSNMLDKREDAFRRLEQQLTAQKSELAASLHKCRQKNEASAKQLDRLSQAAAPAAIFLRENSSEESQAERLASALDDALNN